MTRGKITKYKDTISSPTEISLVQECQHKLHHLSVWEKKKLKAGITLSSNKNLNSKISRLNDAETSIKLQYGTKGSVTASLIVDTAVSHN